MSDSELLQLAAYSPFILVWIFIFLHWFMLGVETFIPNAFGRYPVIGIIRGKFSSEDLKRAGADLEELGRIQRAKKWK